MDLRRHGLREFALHAAALTLALGLLQGPASADVKPGDVITAANVDQVKDLVSPGLEWCIKHGWPMRIAETKKIEWPKAYREATEKYASQAKLAPDGLTLQNYVAGQPFPNPDSNDPQVATKIMW